MILLRQKISSRLNLKPLGVTDPYIRSIDPEDLPLQTLALVSDKLDGIALRKRAFEIKEELKLVDGTALVEIIGGRNREFQIIVDPEKMKESKTSLDEIAMALNNSSLLKDLGLIKTEDKYYHLETQGHVVTVADIEEIVIASNFQQSLKVKDVAKVISQEQEHQNYVRFSQKGKNIDNALFIVVSKLKGRNIVKVSKNIDKKIKEIKERTNLFEDINIEVVKDEGRVASEQIYGLVINLLQAIGIVFLVLLAFLNYRAALIVAVSIPITLLTVFGVGNLFGYTINRITLFALILSLGLLVDSATVAIENIVRNKKLSPNLKKTELIAKSISEVGIALFLSTLTTVIAFIPMAFVTGMMGPYMGPLPFFVSAALIVSLIFSYTINPWLASLFCKDEIKSKLIEDCGFICKSKEAFLKAYQWLLSKLLDNTKLRKIFLKSAAIILSLVMLLPLLKFLRFRMLPKADREQIYVYMDLDRGTSIEKTNSVAVNIADYLKEQDFITSVQSFVGTPPVLDFNGLFKGVSDRRGSHQITLKLNIVHPDERDVTSAELALIFREKVNNYLKKYENIRVQIIEDPPGPPVRSTFHVKVKTNSNKLLKEVTLDIEKKVEQIRELKDIDVSLLEPNDKYIILIDRDRAAKLEVNVDSISRALETIFSGKVIGVYHSDYNYEQEYIVLKFDRSLRDDSEKLKNIYVANNNGHHIAIAELVTVKKSNEDDVLLNDNREKTAYISGEMGKRSVTYASIDLLTILYGYKIPGHKTELQSLSLLTAEYLVDGQEKLKVQLGGEWELTIKVFRDLGLAMLIAIILIYLVLVAQFKTFVIPLLILGTIPLALVGIIPGFAFLFVVGNIYFSATSMIGVIALAGIVVNNAIIFVEYAMQIAKEKKSLKETLIEAGLIRLRPILLTSITTVLGSLVIATDPVWSGLAWAIVFGLSLSTILTLIVLPVLIYQFLGEKWFKEISKAEGTLTSNY